ncbi:hypothetical protein JZ751_024747 [Albula glossodonta]|uniref:PH domain-containing protein n=1 Tax=Albula glossodonta TaxID=121402 RepID=A0A8T2PLY4_9TELE|nr:hypothetical protein JZ751_024747 [Albula glossodonta]
MFTSVVSGGSTRDADEREKWIHALEGTILRHTLQLRSEFSFTQQRRAFLLSSVKGLRVT